jgi:hypothetical protein
MVKSKVENIMKAGFEDWQLWFESLCFEGLAWYSGFHNSSMQAGVATQVKFRVKIQGMSLIGCA